MTTTADQPASHGETSVDRLERMVDEWRGKIDELLVQADLASKDLAGEVRTRVAAAENAYLAAKNELGKIPKDAGADLGSVRAGVEKLLDDLRQAYRSAEDVIRRSRSE